MAVGRVQSTGHRHLGGMIDHATHATETPVISRSASLARGGAARSSSQRCRLEAAVSAIQACHPPAPPHARTRRDVALPVSAAPPAASRQSPARHLSVARPERTAGSHVDFQTFTNSTPVT